MVVHPGRTGTMRGRDFSCVNRMAASRASRSYQEFNFPDRMPGVLDRPPRERRPLVEAAGERIVTARYTGRQETVETVEAPPERVEYETPLFGQPARVVPEYAPYPNTRRKIPWAIIAVVAAALVLAVVGLRFLGPQLHVEPLSLGVIERDGQLQINWNHASQSIVGASAGTLDIVDGGEKRSIPLNRTELAQGSFHLHAQERGRGGSTGGEYLRRRTDGRGVTVSGHASGRRRCQRDGRDQGGAGCFAGRGSRACARRARSQQAARIQQLERTLVILQSRLGITAGR